MQCIADYSNDDYNNDNKAFRQCLTFFRPSTTIQHGLCACMFMCRGSLEIGDMLLDVSAAPMEMTLLGTQGKVCSPPLI